MQATCRSRQGIIADPQLRHTASKAQALLPRRQGKSSALAKYFRVAREAARAAMPGLARDDASVVQLVKQAALRPQEGAPLERRIFEAIDPEAEIVMIGEASHGTHEFYRVRAEVTKLLIQERGFSAVVAEADFPDAFRVNMYVRGMNDDASAEDALSDFIRFPQWMWRNAAVRDFVSWLRAHNDVQRQRAFMVAGPGAAEPGGVDVVTPAHREALAAAMQCGFYGMDVYSMHASAHRVIDFLKDVDPPAAETAIKRYHCFDRYGEDAMSYGMATGLAHQPSCAPVAVAQLRDVLKHRAQYAKTMDGPVGEEMAFQAACNAAVVVGAEKYYKNMFFGGGDKEDLTWNIRDTHFADTCAMVAEHLGRTARRAGLDVAPLPRRARLVLWAHNSHLGDAAATDMGQRRGEVNVGQLMRERYGRDKVFNVGFTTHTGTVAAADEWDHPGQRKAVRKSMPGSYEHLFHRAELPEFALALKRGGQELRDALEGPLLERAIGVIYRPRTERQSHYFYAELPAQFDLVAHIDQTQAVLPLEPAHPSWAAEHEAKEDLPETYPFAV